ncbi:unnamed protein product [Mytilus edulis]|uniref:B box-type domain-containing protein n=1 Tax=Mytilus edulis TaxID=6550 RepID=A0A8S3UZW7_MYTED|nr:unnamed protein product [Mytilus edulis]
MASKMVMCDPCSRLNKSSEGLKYCTDCEDTLCTDCAALHSAVKLLASHHLVDVSVTTGNTFNIKKDCGDHEGMCYEFYCSDHDCLICRTCMANTHRTCGKIQPIDVAAKGCTSSTMLEDITKEITSLLNATKELVVDRQENKTLVKEIKAKVLKVIAKFRQDINDHLDQLEKKLIYEVDTIDKTNREKARNDLKTGHHIKSCTAAGRPFGIAVVTETDEAVVTLSNVRSMQFINLTTVTIGRQIDIDVSRPHGIAVIRDSVYVGSCDGKVSIINLVSKKCVKTVVIGIGYITAVIPFVKDREELLYCCIFWCWKSCQLYQVGRNSCFLFTCKRTNDFSTGF